ncbi:LLM class F420-dependent oxidoreductase [Amycolatopsis sp. NPDC052450]|uniref:LLM class F420-dependent oxidoreductase n=1 Tax=Amycolatopsis sp. NPDC052450 TaxID=3363937 RepID=UPI0037C750FC
MPVKFSIFLPTGFGGELAHITDPVDAFETVSQVARAGDRLGYETLWIVDHLHTIPPSQSTFFECWTTLAALARDTERIRIGQMVTGNNYRNPALQAKMASTVDVLSHGRFTFGIGAGWYESDYHGYGYEYSEAPERLRQLREAVQIILSLWTEDETTFEGKYYQVNGAINQPKGVQRPHVPMLIGGAGEKVTLKLVAQYGDVCNVIESPAGLAHKYGVLKRHCDDAGRDYDSILRTTTSICIMADTDEEARALVPGGTEAIYPGDVGEYGLIGSIDTIHRRIAAYEAAGVQEIAISFPESTDLDVLKRFAEEFIH